MLHGLALLYTRVHRQILTMRQLSLILPKTQECDLKICTVYVHSFSVPKLERHLLKLERMCCILEKITKRNALMLPQSLRLYALTSLHLFGGLFGRGLF